MIFWITGWWCCSRQWWRAVEFGLRSWCSQEDSTWVGNEEWQLWSGSRWCRGSADVHCCGFNERRRESCRWGNKEVVGGAVMARPPTGRRNQDSRDRGGEGGGEKSSPRIYEEATWKLRKDDSWKNRLPNFEKGGESQWQRSGDKICGRNEWWRYNLHIMDGGNGLAWVLVFFEIRTHPAPPITWTSPVPPHFKFTKLGPTPYLPQIG